MKELLFLIFFGLFLLTSCQTDLQEDKFAVSGEGVNMPFAKLPDLQFHYDLESPMEEIIMNDELVEISGLTFSSRFDKLFAVQDEEANIYELNRTNGKIEKTYKFGKSGDFEGIALVNDTIYTVKSNGTLYRVTNKGGKAQQVVEFDTPLDRFNNVEGLCYDATNHQLLLACKGRPVVGELTNEYRYSKAIYAFDLKTNELLKTPKYLISLAAIQFYLENSPVIKELDKLVAFFTSEQDNLVFNPSGIAIHPKTGNLYIISSASKLLILLDAAGNICYMERLNKKLHQQPEGICFDDSGKMYISNEGKSGKARIYGYSYLNTQK